MGVTVAPLPGPAHRLAKKVTLESRKPKSCSCKPRLWFSREVAGKTKLMSLSALVKAAHTMETAQSYQRRQGQFLLVQTKKYVETKRKGTM